MLTKIIKTHEDDCERWAASNSMWGISDVPEGVRMTDRVSGYVVVLDTDMRVDDAEEIKSAVANSGRLGGGRHEGGTNVATTRAVMEITRELVEYLRRRRATPKAIFEDDSVVSPED